MGRAASALGSVGQRQSHFPHLPPAHPSPTGHTGTARSCGYIRANPPSGPGDWRNLIPALPNSRHDAGEVEELGGEICHVAVEEDEEGLDDSDVGGEAGCEGSDHPVNDTHEDAAQRHHEEAEEAEDDIDNGDLLEGGELLKEVVKDLGRRRERGVHTVPLVRDSLTSEETGTGPFLGTAKVRRATPEMSSASAW